MRFRDKLRFLKKRKFEEIDYPPDDYYNYAQVAVQSDDEENAEENEEEHAEEHEEEHEEEYEEEHYENDELKEHDEGSDLKFYDAKVYQSDGELDGNDERKEHDEENDDESDKENTEENDDEGNDTNIIRPNRSKKDYKAIVLGNELTVLLISDSTAPNSTAAMTVRFGSIHDPSDMMGIAHLIEHVLFMGSTKNHGGNDFRSFVTMNGGLYCGMTDMEHTYFSFQIDTSHFEAGLKRFANIFISPLMDVQDIESEINTINQEFEIWKFRDVARKWRLFAHTTHPEHPFNRLTSGNKRSLSNHEPIIIRDTSMKLFANHYVGSCMKLVVVGSDPVHELESWVRKYFSELKSGPEINLAFPKFDVHRWKDCLWKPGVAYILESLECSQSMMISWILPAVSETHVDERPEMFIDRLLSDETEGSLCYFLKSKLWITSLRVCCGCESNFSEVECSSLSSTLAGQLFLIIMDVTDRGWEHKYDMVSYVYQYLNLLKTIDPQYLTSFNEVFKSSMRMRFQCLDSDFNLLCDPTQFSLALAVNMLKFPVSKAISLDFAYDFGDFEAIKEMLGYFNAKNMRIDILSKPFEAKGETEPYYSFKFIEERVPLSYLQKWKIPDETDPGLHLPFKNELMPTTFLMEDYEEEIVGRAYENLFGTWSRSFYKDNKGIFAKASLKIYLEPGQGVIPHMITRIYFEIIKDELSSLLYKAEEGYISTELSFNDSNIIKLELYGLPQKFKYLIASIWEKFKTFDPTPHCFKIITERMKREFYLSSRDIVNHASLLLSEAVFIGPFTMKDKFEVMKYIISDNLISLLPTLRSEKDFEGFFSGSLSKKDCKEITSLFQHADRKIQRVGTKRVLRQDCTYRVFSLPKTKMDTNCLSKVYYQMADDEGFDRNTEPETVMAFLHLLKAMVTEKTIFDLRVKQGLGYCVGCDIHNTPDTRGFYIYIVSPDHKPEYLLMKIYAFIASIPDFLAGVDDETFNLFKSGVNLSDNSGIDGDLAGLMLEEMEKANLVDLFDYHFLKKPTIVEIVIGKTSDHLHNR